MGLRERLKIAEFGNDIEKHGYGDFLPRTLVIATDFSSNAREAMQHAIEHFRTSVDTLVLVNIFAIPSISIGSPVTVKDILFQLSDEALEREENIARDFIGNSPIRIEKYCEGGDVVKKLPSVLEKYTKPLLVIGETGASEIEGVYHGSVASRLVAAIKNTPIFLTPCLSDQREIKNLLYLSDVHEEENLQNLNYLVAFAIKFGAKIHVAHISERNILLPSSVSAADRDLMPLYSDTFPEVKFSYQNLNGVASIDEQLHKIIRQEEIDMLYMVLKSDGFLNDVFSEKLSQKKAFYHKIPTICFRVD